MDSIPAERAGAAEIADLVGATPGVWSVVIAHERDLPAALHQLLDEYQFAAQEAGGGAVERLAARTPGDLLRAVEALRPDDVLMLTGSESWTPEQIALLDLQRNAMQGRARVVVLTTHEGAVRLREGAPNLWSWLGSRCFELESSIGEMDSEARLASLRTFFDMSDEEVVRRAEAGQLPTDPSFAEWLILLGRDDLLGP